MINVDDVGDNGHYDWTCACGTKGNGDDNARYHLATFHEDYWQTLQLVEVIPERAFNRADRRAFRRRRARR